MEKFKKLNIFLEVERGECGQTEELPLKSIFTHTNHMFLQDCFTHLKPVPPITDILSCYGGLIKTAFEFFWESDETHSLVIVTWWLTETRRWEWYSLPVELKLSSSQKVTVRNDCGSHRCLHLSDLGSPDIGRGRRKWSQMIGGGTPNGSGVPFPSTEVKTKKGSFWATLVADGR